MILQYGPTWHARAPLKWHILDPLGPSWQGAQVIKVQ